MEKKEVVKEIKKRREAPLPVKILAKEVLEKAMKEGVDVMEVLRQAKKEERSIKIMASKEERTVKKTIKLLEKKGLLNEKFVKKLYRAFQEKGINIFLNSSDKGGEMKIG